MHNLLRLIHISNVQSLLKSGSLFSLRSLSSIAPNSIQSLTHDAYRCKAAQNWKLGYCLNEFHTSTGLFAEQSPETVTVTYIDKEGKPKTVHTPVGKNLLEIAHENEIDLEGACEGSLACSTCHVIVQDQEQYKKLPEPCEDEMDMLDLAFGLTPTSRLGCQVIMTKDLDGLVVRLPSATRNFYVDGHVPKPH